MSTFRLKSAHFLTSAQNLSQCPPPIISEVAFLGRSNVGKSTLINLLCHQKQLAKSSQTPGKTQLINFFLTQWSSHKKQETRDSKVSKDKESAELLKVIFVDLPGFGYAKVSKEQKELWNHNLVEFLQKRDRIRLFVHLVDSRHPYLEIDESLIVFLERFLREDQRLLRIFTKFDKLNANEQALLKRSFPKALFSSALKRQNTEKIANCILANTLGSEELR